MAYKIIGENDTHISEQGKTHLVSYHVYIGDYESDVADLPDKEKTALESVAFIIETGNLYGLTENGWQKVGG